MPAEVNRAFSKVKSLAKAVHILKCFTSARPELGVSEISRELHLPKSTVHNVLDTFADEGLVEQDPVSGKYRLGLQILYLGNVMREGLGLRRVALPVMEKAKELFRETVHLATEQDGMIVYLESVQPPDRSVGRLAMGKWVFMHCTGLGKAILAYMPEEQVQSIVAHHGLREYTPNTIHTIDDLLVALKEIHARGYAVDNMEHEWGIRCIAVPIWDEDGQVKAAMSISGPSERFPLSDIDAKARTLVAMGLEVSHALGYRGEGR